MIKKLALFGILGVWTLIVIPCYALSNGVDDYFKINPINVIAYDDQFIPQYIKCDVLPIIEQGRILVPLRNIAETLMFNVEWEEISQNVCLYKENKKIELKIGETYAKIDDRLVHLDVLPKIINGRTMVPLRFIAESMNMYVEWYEDPNGKVFIWLSSSHLLSDTDCVADDNYLLISSDGYKEYTLIDGKQTTRGIIIGDTEENVIKVYGNPHLARTIDNEKSYIYSTKSYPGTDDGKAIIFVFFDGIVTKVMLSIG